MHAQDLMTHPAITCHVNDSLNRAAHLMWDHDCGSIAVVNDDGKVTGMITDRDICMAAYTQGRPLESMLVNSAMASHLISVRPEQSLAEVEQLMATHQVRRLPIVDGDGKPVGVISIDDLAKAAALPATRITHGLPKIAHTMAAICRSRKANKAA